MFGWIAKKLLKRRSGQGRAKHQSGPPNDATKGKRWSRSSAGDAGTAAGAAMIVPPVYHGGFDGGGHGGGGDVGGGF